MRKLIPLTVLSAVLYGGYNLYRHGAFRRGLRGFPSTLTSLFHRLPVFGSHFRHSGAEPRYALAPSSRGRVWRHPRRHGRRPRRHRHRHRHRR